VVNKTILWINILFKGKSWTSLMMPNRTNKQLYKGKDYSFPFKDLISNLTKHYDHLSWWSINLKIRCTIHFIKLLHMWIKIATSWLRDSRTLMRALLPWILPKNMLFSISFLSLPQWTQSKTLISSNVYVEIYL
jgi:hypothetical protein